MKLPLRNTMLLPLLFSASVVWALPDEVVENNVDTGVQTEASEEEAATPEYVEGEVIVRFKTEGLQAKGITALQDEFGVTNFTSLSAIGMQLWEISSDTKSIIEKLNKDDRIEYAEPNFIIKLEATPDDTDFEKLWGLDNTGQTSGTEDADIDALEAWGEITTPKDSVIAVIDTGVDYNHSDLAANMWKNKGETKNGEDDDGNGYVDDVYGYDFHNNDADPMDDHYHGTHVAGTIAAVGNNGEGVIGVNPKGKIMALKFLSAGGSGTIANAIRAVDYAANNGAKLSNNSWGCSGCNSSALYDAIRAAGEKGHLFIAAAGNAAHDNDTGNKNYPSSYDLDNIIAVAATDHNDDMASFSSYGLTTVDLGAPGVSIYSTAPGDSYRSLNGTSMATPHVAGAVSLMLSECADLESNVLKKVIMNTADPVASLDGKTVTGGRLNVHQALLHDALKVCRDRDTTPPPSYSVCGEDNLPEFKYANQRKNGKFGDVKVPYLALPLIDPITERYTDIGIFANAKLDVYLKEGVEEFDVLLNFDSSSLVEIRYKKDFYKNYFGSTDPERDMWKRDAEGKIVMVDGNTELEPTIERKCYALYTYENKTLHLPILGIPTYVKLPNDDIVMIKGNVWYGMSLVRVPAQVVGNDGEHNTDDYAPYKAKYIYRLDYNTFIRVGDERLPVKKSP
jgi:subtilisin family serine protease